MRSFSCACQDFTIEETSSMLQDRPFSYVPTPLTSISGIKYGEANGIPHYLDLLCPYPPPTTPLPTLVSLVCSAWEEAHRGWVMVPWGNPLFASHHYLTVSASVRLSWQAPFPAQI